MQLVYRINPPEPFVKIRLQAPTLTLAGVKPIHASLFADSSKSIGWSGQAGDLLLRGDCQPDHNFSWRLNFVLENHGDKDEEVRVTLPYVFYHFDQDRPVRTFSPLFGGVLEETQIPLRISYPGPASFCMTAAVGLECSVAVGLFNADQRHVVIRHIPAGVDGQIRFVFERVFVASGQTVELPTMFISTGVDWAEAMRPYRDWFQTAFPRRRGRPEWWERGSFAETRFAHCLAPVNPPDAAAGVWIFDNEGRPRAFGQVKAEIDEIVEQGLKKGFQPLFYQFGWWQNMAEIQGLFMFDSLCGDYTAAHKLAREVVEYIHSRGARTYFYTNAISAGDETEVYRQHPELFVRDASGFPVYNMEYPMLMFCPGAPGMREYWERILQYLLVDLGVDGLFLDQVCGGAPPAYCYNPDHHHAHPDTYGRDFLALIDFIAELARRLKPDAYIGGELVQDSRGVLLDEAHGYGYTGPRTRPLASPEALRGTPPAEYYVFTRTLCPEIYSSHAASGLALMNGAAGHPADALWRDHRPVFESNCTPCRVEPPGALAYLYGPKDGRAVLAVRASGSFGQVKITLPGFIDVRSPLPFGLVREEDGAFLCAASEEAKFYILSAVQEDGN